MVATATVKCTRTPHVPSTGSLSAPTMATSSASGGVSPAEASATIAATAARSAEASAESGRIRELAVGPPITSPTTQPSRMDDVMMPRCTTDTVSVSVAAALPAESVARYRSR